MQGAPSRVSCSQGRAAVQPPPSPPLTLVDERPPDDAEVTEARILKCNRNLLDQAVGVSVLRVVEHPEDIGLSVTAALGKGDTSSTEHGNLQLGLTSILYAFSESIALLEFPSPPTRLCIRIETEIR